ncbi:hypothetical protein MVEN_01336500 [Mycena venus]|uniref:C2H2-type domain-containing protein n=1 Tax=Mycena venus TaxID=2733690 RepID=A0A8H7CU37_9AGAR|nr:hypothetical protein MVEN_01336500 [Mycena venus]
MERRPAFNKRDIRCPHCTKRLKNQSGLTQHLRSKHRPFAQRVRSPVSSSGSGSARSPSPQNYQAGGDVEERHSPSPEPPLLRIRQHPILNGRPCDEHGNFLPPGAPPPPSYHAPPDNWAPYVEQADFDLADLLYRRVQMSAADIDELMQNWVSRPGAADPPFANHRDLYSTIDATAIGHVPWQSFNVSWNGVHNPDDNTPWKNQEYTVYFRDPLAVLKLQLANPDFKFEMDFAPKQVFGGEDRNLREYMDFMSGNWAWEQADIIVQDPATHGATFVPVILGSDKTTVSVATGQNEYYPLYMSNGLVHNNVRRAHRNAVTLIGFLAIPKTDRENQDTAEFRTFRRNLFHASLRQILQSLRPGMTTPEVVKFADGHYRRAIYGLGPYIADYPEQVLLACVVQGWCTASNKDLDGEGGRRSHAHTDALFDAFDHKTMWDDYGVIPDVLPFTHGFPRADIHELLSPDLLHQGEYLEIVHGKKGAARIMTDIDRRIAAVPPFGGLCRFLQGRGFKQWTGDDSKALMKVYLPAIEGYVPPQMLAPSAHFWSSVDAALARYHHERTIFEQEGVCPNGFSLPRQHSLVHYRYLVQQFGAPNGLCSSITESKHIKAVKEPWRHSSKFQALGQMLTINERLDKLAASRVDFVERGMIPGTVSSHSFPPSFTNDRTPRPPHNDADDDDGGASDRRDVIGEVVLAQLPALADFLRIPTLPNMISRFLYSQQNPDNNIPLNDVPLEDCPSYRGNVFVYPSAITTFYAPSDQSGIAGMHRERIWAVRSWRGGAARYDCVFVEQDTEKLGFRGLHAAHVLAFMSLKVSGVVYPCALVTWFSAIGDEPCPDVGMWMVEPDLDADGEREMNVIHLDSILRAAHLIPVYGDDPVPRYFKYTHSLDLFAAFYVNKYADHHSHEIAF